MTDEPVIQVTENVPSTRGSISAIASANSPFVYFDNASNFGTYGGIAHITLIAGRFLNGPDGTATHDYVVTGHLRCNLAGLQSLKAAIEGIEKMLKVPDGTKIN